MDCFPAARVGYDQQSGYGVPVTSWQLLPALSRVYNSSSLANVTVFFALDFSPSIGL